MQDYAVATDPGDSVQNAEREKRLLEIASFADTLSREGDCYRAETEYERFAFLRRDEEARWWAHMKVGECYFRQSEWKTAAELYAEAAPQGLTAADRNDAWRMAAASHFNGGNYQRSLRDLDTSSPVESTDSVHTDFLRGLCFLALGEWKAGGARFQRIADNAREPAVRRAALFLARKADTGPDVPHKNATLAEVLSAVVPGSGQVYAKRGHDGVRHFIFDGLLIYTVYWLFKEDNYSGGYLLAGFTLPFYAGNIIGAGRSAEYFSDSKRLEHLSSWIDQANGL
jgi:tetratricopeptide (TPR) repeat protein